MGTTVFHGTDGAITQAADAWVFDPVAPVLLKTNSTPGVAPHANTSKSIWNALASIVEQGVQMSNRYSAMDTGKHAPVVIVGTPTLVKDHPNGFLSWAKDVYHEAGEMVHHGVETAVNSVLTELAPATINVAKNARDVISGMTAKDFEDASEETLKALMEMVKDPQTYVGLGISLGAIAVQGVPVLGQAVGGAVLAKTIYDMGASGEAAINELKDIMSTWTGGPLTPEQLAEARKRLAAWILGAGASIIGVLIRKAIRIVRNKRSEKVNDHEKPVNSNQHPDDKSPCVCALAHPVLIVTGEKLLDETDFEIPGPIPIRWRRRYRSGDLEGGPWGTGWTNPLFVELRVSANCVIFRDEQGRPVPLPLIPPGGAHFELGEAFTLSRPDEQRWLIEYKTGLQLHFASTAESTWRLPLLAMSDRNGNHVQLHWQTVQKSDASNDFSHPQLIGVTDSVGRQLKLLWKSQRLATVELNVRGSPTQALVSYEYDAQGQLVASFHGGQPWRQYAWRGGVLVGYRKANGARFFADYDEEGPHGRVVRSWCADTGEGHHFKYDFRERFTWATDALGRSTGFRFNAGFDIVETIAPDGTRVETPMNANHLPTGIVDAMGRRSSNRFDARGNLTLHTSADGARTRLEYNALDLPMRITDALGYVWTREYDERGNLLASTDPLGNVTRYEYDARGNVVTIVDATAKRKHLTWDAQNNLTQYVDCSSRSTYYRHDLLGRLLERSDALNHRTHYAWSLTGQLVQVKEADGAEHQYRWDGEGNLLAYTDPLGAITQWRYDGGNRPVQRQDAAGRLLQYRYDSAGRLLELDNENNAATRFGYDIVDNLTDEIGFDNRWQRYVYNAAGELTHLIEAGDDATAAGPGKVTNFERDSLGRLLVKRAHASEHMSERISQYSYDALGRLLQANNSSAQLQFAYDAVGNLLSQSQQEPANSQSSQAPHPRPGRPFDARPFNLASVLDHCYDPLGNRTQTTLPDGRSLHYLYYGSGHLHQIELEQTNGDRHTLSDIERDALHQEVSRSQGDLSSHYNWDPMGRLQRHKVSRGVIRDDHAPARIERQYQWDKAGQLTGRQDNMRGAQQFGYDPTGRIKQALGGPLGSEMFAFDPAGNLLNEPDQSRHTGFPALVADNRIRVHRDLRYDYDVHGNVTLRLKGKHEASKFIWNAEHQLEQANVQRHGVRQTTTYQYDALGRRNRKSSTFGETHYLWDGNLLIESCRGHHSNLFIYEPNSFVPLATVQGTTEQANTYWYQCDQVGVPQELTDRQGNIVWAADYKAWGEAKVRDLATGTDGPQTNSRGPRPIWHGWEGTGDHAGYLRGERGSNGVDKKHEPPQPVEQPFRLQGQQVDEETGLHYNRYRYYDPEIGRFVSEDPIRLLGGINIYAYVYNPISWIDPLGLAGNPAGATHITYVGMKNGVPYIGYASMPGCQNPDAILKYRYSGNFSVFDKSQPPQIIYVGYGQRGKDTARGLEQKTFEDYGGMEKTASGQKKTANKQNPVGENNGRIKEYTAAAKAHCPCGKIEKPNC